MENNEKKPKNQKHVTYNFNAPIGQFIEHVEAIYNGNGNNNQQNLFPQLPAPEQMKQAVEATVGQGYWWSSRAWAVVYRVYQMKGYMKGYTQFAREVNEWGIKTGFECNYDAVQKPIATGMFSGMPDKWIEQGAQGQAVKLAYALIQELDKIS